MCFYDAYVVSCHCLEILLSTLMRDCFVSCFLTFKKNSTFSYKMHLHINSCICDKYASKYKAKLPFFGVLSINI